MTKRCTKELARIGGDEEHFHITDMPPLNLLLLEFFKEKF